MFRKYNSIENTYREELLQKIYAVGLGDAEYVVQEKVHGANLSYWTTDGVTFRAAKRTSELAPGERFHNYEAILTRHQARFQQIWQELKVQFPELSQLTLFGELIGGSYPHKEVPRDKTAIKVQKGIFYAPQNEFFGFDILINLTDFLDVKSTNSLFEKQGILHAKTLFEGTLKECLAHSNEFQSTIAADLGLPLLEENICEGVIIRPKTPLFMPNGSRVLLKNKNDKWSEKASKKKHGTRKSQPDLPAHVLEWQAEIATYITENRLNNVLSKIGEVTPKDYGRILGMFNKDILDDFQKDNPGQFDDWEKQDLKAVTKSIGKPAAELVQAYFYQVST